MTATARKEQRRDKAQPKNNTEPKKSAVTGLQFTRRLQALEHRAAILDFLGGQLGPWFVAQDGFPAPHLIETPDGSLERARLPVVCRIATELSTMAEEAHKRIRKLLGQDVRELRVEDAPLDENDDEPSAYTAHAVAPNPRART